MEVRYKKGDIQRIFDTEDFLDREYDFVRKELRKFRLKNNFSVRKMGELLGSSGMNISLVERGKVRPNTEMLSSFVKVRYSTQTNP